MKINLAVRATVLFVSLCLPAFAPTPARAADGKPGIGLKLIAEGFTSPTALIPLDDASGRLLVADQIGIIHVLGKDLMGLMLAAAGRLIKYGA